MIYNYDQKIIIKLCKIISPIFKAKQDSEELEHIRYVFVFFTYYNLLLIECENKLKYYIYQ